MKIIKIGAIWCPGCLVMKKVWNNIGKKYDLNILELDYDVDNNEVNKFNVGNILPVVIFLDNSGNEVERLIGEIKESKLIELIGWNILNILLTLVTLGIGAPWGKCMLLRYEIEHTVLNGKRLKFIGNGGNLFVEQFNGLHQTFTLRMSHM